MSTSRPVCAVLGALLTALLLAACGSDAGSNTNANATSGAGQRPDSARLQKLRAALAKCGVDFRGGPPSGQQPPQDQGQGTPSTSAS